MSGSIGLSLPCSRRMGHISLQHHVQRLCAGCKLTALREITTCSFLVCHDRGRRNLWAIMLGWGLKCSQGTKWKPRHSMLPTVDELQDCTDGW